MVSPNIDGQLHLNLKLDRKYAIEYKGLTDTITTNNLRPEGQVGTNWKFAVGQMWVVPNVYYDLNKWSIRKDGAKELDKLVKILKENLHLEIEMSSNTDCRAGSRYNMVLSARRAKAAVDYLVQHGIKMKRIIAIGYGESKITNGCTCEPSNYSPCEESQHQANRRTEVKVLKY
jgi:outer membrane protein OmpA-like peptidoglycan-associated protein